MRALKLTVLSVASSLLLAPAAFASGGGHACGDHHHATETAAPKGAEGATARKATTKTRKSAEAKGKYVCPMGPECGGWHDAPGECAQCGMTLIPASELKQ